MMIPAFNRTIWQTLQEALEPEVGREKSYELASVLLPVVTRK